MRPDSHPKKRNPAGGPGFAGKQTIGIGLQLDASAGANDASMAPDVDVVLSRLERVRTAGTGWTARCPAHEDRTASLSIGVGSQGRLLLHCFAGCSVHDVLTAIGLVVADLFPRRLAESTPEERREARRRALQAQVTAAVRVLEREAEVLQLCACDLAGGLPLTDQCSARLALAQERIAAARQVLSGGHYG